MICSSTLQIQKLDEFVATSVGYRLRQECVVGRKMIDNRERHWRNQIRLLTRLLATQYFQKKRMREEWMRDGRMTSAGQAARRWLP